MTFNKTQTSPHWHLIKERGHPENKGRRDTGEEPEASPGKQTEAPSQVQGRAVGLKRQGVEEHRDQTNTGGTSQEEAGTRGAEMPERPDED